MKRRGSVPLLVGTLAATLVAGVGVTIDLGRAWLVEARIQSAIDAAGLAAARRMSESNVQTSAKQIFWANLTQGGRPATFLGATIAEPVVTLEPNATNPERVRVEGSATVPLTLGSLLGSRTMTVSHTAVARRSASGLELALVLDISGSMFGTRLEIARAAAKNMVDILHGGPEAERAPNLFISVVPVAGDINIGTVNSHMLNTTGMAPGWDLDRWTGCVEARAANFELTDDAPSAGARFRPYFWRSTFRQVGTVEGGRCTAANAYPADPAFGGQRFCHGDNDWFDYATNTVRTNAELAGNRRWSTVNGWGHHPAASPNLACTRTPIMPLAARRATVQAALDALGTAPGSSFSNGSILPPGLQGAWYTLSPQWRGQWRNDPNAGVPDVPALPLDYGLPFRRKAIVFMTDGAPGWIMPSANGTDYACGNINRLGAALPAGTRGVCSSATGIDLHYSAYGRVADWNTRFPTRPITGATPAAVQAAAGARLNQQLLATCSAIKDSGIEIYIVGFDITPERRTRLQTCASSPDHYFEAPTIPDLNQAFARVAAQLGNLALAQ